MEKSWESANIRTSLGKLIRIAIKKKIDPSITNTNQFVDLAVREKLDRMEAAHK